MAAKRSRPLRENRRVVAREYCKTARAKTLKVRVVPGSAADSPCTLIAQVVLGLAGIPLSMQHMDGSEMVKFMGWAQRIWTFRGGAAELVANVSIVFKLHLVLGLTVFLLFPFTRLVHIWSGFVSVFYLFRPYQLMRSRRAGR